MKKLNSDEVLVINKYSKREETKSVVDRHMSDNIIQDRMYLEKIKNMNKKESDVLYEISVQTLSGWKKLKAIVNHKIKLPIDRYFGKEQVPNIKISDLLIEEKDIIIAKNADLENQVRDITKKEEFLIDDLEQSINNLDEANKTAQEFGVKYNAQSKDMNQLNNITDNSREYDDDVTIKALKAQSVAMRGLLHSSGKYYGALFTKNVEFSRTKVIKKLIKTKHLIRLSAQNRLIHYRRIADNLNSFIGVVEQLPEYYRTITGLEQHSRNALGLMQQYESIRQSRENLDRATLYTDIGSKEVSRLEQATHGKS